MKKSILALCALTLAAGLSACGGGTSSYTIGGAVTGLQYPGLVLQNNAANDLAVSPLGLDASGNVKNVTYSFPGEVDYGDLYSVTVKTQPLHQTCVTSSGTADTAGRPSSINAVIACGLVSNTIGGTIEGLTADNLILNNGGVTQAIVKDATTGVYPTTFTFSSAVVYGSTYGVTIYQDPTGQKCEVLKDAGTGISTGAGTMGDTAVASIKIKCVPAAT